MNYQKSILKKYKQAYPRRTLKSISEETGIQMTRVFRLFNGAEMKLKEYESFEASLRKSSLSASKSVLMEKFQQFVEASSESRLALLEIEFDHVLKIEQFLGNTEASSLNFPSAS